MPETDVSELHAPVADVDVGRLGERAVGRIEDHLGEVGRHLGHLGGDPRPTDLAGPLDERDAAFVAPDRRRPEDVVAEGMVEVAVRVDDDRHRRRSQRPQVVGDLARLDMGRPRVDQQHVVAAQHDPDVLIVELVAADEHPVADLGPDSHRRIVVAGGAGRGIDKLLSTH